MQEVEWLSIMWGHIFTLRWNRSRQPGSYPVFLLSMVFHRELQVLFQILNVTKNVTHDGTRL